MAETTKKSSALPETFSDVLLEKPLIPYIILSMAVGVTLDTVLKWSDTFKILK